MMINKYNPNVTLDMFKRLPEANDCTTTDEDGYTKAYGIYPASDWGNGRSLCFTGESGRRKICNFTEDEKLRFKRIVAHMYEKSNDLTEVCKRISLAKVCVEQIKDSSMEEAIKEMCLQSPQLSLEDNKLRQAELHNALMVLLALLIKDSYNLDQRSRWSIIEFLKGLGNLIFQLDTVLSQQSMHGVGFMMVYDSITPGSSSGLFSVSLIIGKDKAMIPVFAFSSKDLKPLALPLKLEAKCPF